MLNISRILIRRDDAVGMGDNTVFINLVVMKEDARKELLVAYQRRKQDEITHHYLDEKVTVGLLFHMQALLFARYLRNDIDGYPPYIWR